jgi:hypothetical protein
VHALSTRTGRLQETCLMRYPVLQHANSAICPLCTLQKELAAPLVAPPALPPPIYTCMYIYIKRELCQHDPRTFCTIQQGGQDVTKWLLQTSLSDPNYRHLDLWEILDYHLVEINRRASPQGHTSTRGVSIAYFLHCSLFFLRSRASSHWKKLIVTR